MHAPILQPFGLVGRPTPDSSNGGSTMLRRFVALAGVAATIAVIPASSGDARSPASGLRLIAGIHHIDVSRFAYDPCLFFPPAIYVAPTSGGFQIDVSRHPGGGLE